MREVRVKVPHGRGEPIVELALDVGIREASVHRELTRARGGEGWVDVISVETSTPLAAAFAEAVQTCPAFVRTACSITIRELRAVVTREGGGELTPPLARPWADVGQELWQFSHVTWGHVGRVLIAAALLAYGMIEDNLLTMIAGLLFLPSLPQLMAIAHGARAKDGALARRGASAIVATLALVAAGAAIVGLVSRDPLRFNAFPSPLASALISGAVGVAAALATVDDVGRRELIGLATAAQLAVTPAWLGISAVRGFPDASAAAQRGLSLAVNVCAIVVLSYVTYAIIDRVNHRRREHAASEGMEPASAPR